MNKITYIFPNWLHPNNIGDTMVSTFIPSLLKLVYADYFLEVVVSDKLYDILKLDTSIDLCREPYDHEIHMNYVNLSLGRNQSNELLKTVYPAWHPQLFEFWKINHELLSNHPTANIITVNFLLQLGLQHLLFDSSFDFKPRVNKNKHLKTSDSINIGIVISTKLAGKSQPHPGCNGIGYRYKLEHWKRFVEYIKSKNSNITIYEFSENFMEIGDKHYGYVDSYDELFDQIDTIDLGIMSDGGLHHAFNTRNIPIVLFQSNVLSKVEFLRLHNSNYPEHLHLQCRHTCRSYFSEIFNVTDKSKTCNMECEDLDPIGLAEYTLNVIKDKL